MYKHILIPTDGSEFAAKGVEHGLALAKELKASATIVTVTSPWSPVDMTAAAHAGKIHPTQDFKDANSAAARSILDEAKAKADAAGLDVNLLHMAEMHAAEGIIHAARDRGCDLIVMASHGRRGIKRVILGSQTAEVITTVHIPVLVVR